MTVNKFASHVTPIVRANLGGGGGGVVLLLIYINVYIIS
jgi:hypothetical protein